MNPGETEWFRYFLSTRWGVPTTTIDKLPAQEFQKQYIFWSKFKYGITDDLLSLLISQTVSARTGNKPVEESYLWKDVALKNAGKVIKRIITNTTTAMRHQWMMFAQIAGKEKDARKDDS